VARGVECQDAYGIRTLQNGIILIAVADGAGSAKRSADGAKHAVETSLTHLSAVLENLSTLPDSSLEDALRGALLTARSAVAGLANAALGLTPDDFATTLILVTITPDWIGVAQIGDGAVVARLREDEQLSVMAAGENSEYLNETTFITSGDALSSARADVAAASSISGIAAMSDGMQLLAIEYGTNSPFKPFFTPLFRFASTGTSTEAELASFLESPRVCSRTDDDKTLVIAVKADGTSLL
jgi:hypothetical protein